jgi:uracil-DNA glycosylase
VLAPSADTQAPSACNPGRDCPLCDRLVAFRHESRSRFPEWFNAPVPTFGQSHARLLVVGLAPGLRGANRTGRPFTGDFAGELLYETLLAFGLAVGRYGQSADDGLTLMDCAITNAVRCVPPQNKPTPVEIATCRRYLAATIGAMPELTAIIALGRIAHDSIVRSLGRKIAELPFAHGREHLLPDLGRRGLALFDSYHCSRYNTNTGVLTAAMFREVFAKASARMGHHMPAGG